MSRIVYWCVLITSIGVVVCLSASAPTILGDSNKFLREFIGVGFLSVLGVILSITLASCAQLHLNLIATEQRLERVDAFASTRRSVRVSAYSLIGLFCLAVAVTVMKPLASTEEWQQSLFNGAALLILLSNVLILVSITRTVFRIQI